MMLMVCGIAVDLMHNEMVRTRVQNTLDRAVLAASDLDQPLPPDEVVDDYFAKAGMSEYLQQVVITPGANLPTTNYRTVSAYARTRTPSPYMGMTGVHSLPAAAFGTAEETIENTEISLVLDISGSMRFDSKIVNLRVAAKEFISAVLEGGAATTTSLNIVPYAGQVNPGAYVFKRAGGAPINFPAYYENSDGDDVLYGYSVTDEEGNELAVPYNTVAYCLDLTDDDFDNINLPSGGYTQTAYFMNWRIAADVMDWGWCPQQQTSIQYAQNNIIQLHEFIDNMRMHDGTGTQYGMKYGVALLNPSSKDEFLQMSKLGIVPLAFADRPAAFDDDETRKYIVLMTDGQITDQYRPKDFDPINATNHLNGDRRTSFSSRNTNRDNFYSVCDKAKAEGIIVWTIAFQAPESARTEMRNCATSLAFFYDVEGVEISSAFKSIARQINELRLTE